MKLNHILLVALCSVGLSAAAQGQTFTRNKVLLEKFTGIYCTWCSSGDRAVEGYLNRHPEHRDVMVEMRHNSYPSYDNLTVPMHKSIDAVWKPNGYPKYFVDRCAVNGQRYAQTQDFAIGWDDFNTSSFDPVAKRLNVPTHVSLSLEGSTYDPATQQLTIYAHGQVTADLPNLCINVFIVQDIDGYENTSRASMTADLNGDRLPVFDGEYNVAYTVKLPASYGNYQTMPAKMKAIAFVSSRYTTDAQGNNDFSDSEVHNTDVVSLTSLPATSIIPDKCAAPTIAIEGGKVVFECSEAGAAFDYSVVPVEATTTSSVVSSTGDDSPAFIIKAIAGTAHTLPSDTISQRFTLADILKPGEVDAIQTPCTSDNAAASAAAYTISGQRLPSASGSRLVVPGLYIIGGKKVSRR